MDNVTIYYMDSNFNKLGILQNYELDFDFVGNVKDTSNADWTITTNNTNNQLKIGYYWYIKDTEIGGVVDGMKEISADNSLTYYGRNWRGIMQSKVLIPPSSGYLIMAGNIENIVTSLISKTNLTSIFKAEGDKALANNISELLDKIQVLESTNASYKTTIDKDKTKIEGYINSKLKSLGYSTKQFKDSKGTFYKRSKKSVTPSRIYRSSVVSKFSKTTKSNYDKYKKEITKYEGKISTNNKTLNKYKINLSNLYKRNNSYSIPTKDEDGNNNWQFGNYGHLYAELMEMVGSIKDNSGNVATLRLKFDESIKKVTVSVCYATNWYEQENIQYKDYQNLNFTIDQFKGGVNHLIAKGKVGDTTKIYNYYTDKNGNVTTTQYFKSQFENVEYFENSSAETWKKFKNEAIAKLKEIRNKTSFTIDINDSEICIDDKVGAKSTITGIVADVQVVTNIVAKIENNIMTLEYKVGEESY